MYLYYILSARRFGNDVAEKILEIQSARLSKSSDEIGKLLVVAIRQINQVVTSQINEPSVIEVSGNKIQVPIEYAIAMEFLIAGKDAPFYVDPQNYNDGNLPDMNGADFALAQCLEHGKTSAQSYFQNFSETANVSL
jgi:hypothetical protein